MSFANTDLISPCTWRYQGDFCIFRWLRITPLLACYDGNLQELSEEESLILDKWLIRKLTEDESYHILELVAYVDLISPCARFLASLLPGKMHHPSGKKEPLRRRRETLLFAFP